MKESALDVLMYLFEQYLDDEVVVEADRESISDALLEAGFAHAAIDSALAWLDGLTGDVRSDGPRRPSALHRVYTREECERLDVRCRGYLLSLEQTGMLDPTTRERVVERVMALEAEEIDLDQLKWIVLLVTFNQPGRDGASSSMEGVGLDLDRGLLH